MARRSQTACLACAGGRQRGEHAFDQLCADLDIEHRLTRPKSPRTNGMVERFNGRIEEVLQSHHAPSGEELEATLNRCLWLYNQKLSRVGFAQQIALASHEGLA